VKVTTLQQKVLSAIQLESGLSIERISERTGLPNHSIQYALARLKEEKVIRPFLVLNIHKLGLTDYCLFLNPIGYNSSLVKRASEIFKNDPSVAYAIQLAGEYLFSVSCFGLGIASVDNLFARLRAKLPEVSWDIQFAIRVEWTIFRRGYLGKASKGLPYLVRTVHTPPCAIDEKDKIFLTALSAKADQPLSRVSHAAGLPEATGRIRYNKLKELGLIQGTPCQIDHSALGLISYRITISVNFRKEETDAAFRKFGIENASISDFVICIGAWDYEYNFQVENPLKVSEWINNLYEKFPGIIRGVRTMADVSLIKNHQVDLTQGF